MSARLAVHSVHHGVREKGEEMLASVLYMDFPVFLLCVPGLLQVLSCYHMSGFSSREGAPPQVTQTKVVSHGVQNFSLITMCTEEQCFPGLLFPQPLYG